MTTTPISDREQLIRDTFCTCIEGGSAYWLVGLSRRQDDEREAVGWYYTHIDSAVQGDDAEPIVGGVSLAHVELGFRRIVDGSVSDINATNVGQIMLAWLRPDEAALDAGDADIVLQAGLFGSLVYG